MTLDNDKARELFNAARNLPSAEREPFLDKECGDDDALRDEVETLLSHIFTSENTEDSGDGGGSTIDYEVGDTIGKFKIIGVLGEGGMGIVYLAEQSKPVRRRVALKVIKAGMDTKQVIARFEAERQALAMMNHAGIAQVYEAGATEQGRPYFVLEFVKGMPITEACDEHKLDTKQRLELIAKVCDAVQHAHTKGIIHRDLKPSNILVSLGEDDVLEPKIIDFGVAKATNQQLTDKTLVTQVGRFIGTPSYMSPEQADLKAIDIDTRTDVYALGVVTYEVLTGFPPFDPQTLRDAGLEKMREIIRTQPPPKPSTQLSSIDDDDATKIAESHQIQISALAGMLRKELEWIPLKALRKRRSERYDSAKSMGDDIRRYLVGEALVAGPESTIYRFKKTLIRHRILFIAATTVVLSLVIGMAVAIIGWTEASTQRGVSGLVLNLLLMESEDTLNPSRETKKKIYDDRIEQLEKIQNELGDSPELFHAIGLTYQHLGRWHKNSPDINQSDFNKALDQYNAALNIANRLDKYPQDVGTALVRIGDLHKQAKNYPEALEYYEEALPFFQLDVGNNKEWHAKAKTNIFDVYEKTGRVDDALILASEFVSDARANLKDSPGDSSKQRALGNRLQRLASVYSKQSSNNQAIDKQREALALYIKLNDLDPRFSHMKDVAWANYFLAEYLFRDRKHAEGMTSLENGLDAIGDCVTKYPEHSKAESEFRRFTEAYSGLLKYLEHNDTQPVD
jgi:eukaryotic-like serine/threonine-protein kinase